MSNIHQILMPQNILYGTNSFAGVGRQAASLGSKAMIISDPVMEQIGHVSLCRNYLERAGLSHASYTGVNTEPTDLHVQEALEICTGEACDVIVALGGGSAIDAAKAVAVLMSNGGHIREYVGNKKRFQQKPLPLVAIPTTAGTGSEMTKVTVIIDTANDVKMMLSQPELLPAAAIVDPLLTVSCPPSVTAATGVDALCHAVEAYISRRAQPVTDMMAFRAIELIAGNLLQAYRQGDDIEARSHMALAAMLAGAAFSNASVTLVHGMSRPIGALFHVPHGVSNAMLLPAVLEFTRESAAERLAAIGRHILPDGAGLSDSELADSLIAQIKRLCLDLNIPNMQIWGIDEAAFQRSLAKMAQDALDSGSPGNNPRVPTHQEIVELYRVSYAYDFS
ncbi:iron-containing alcohol dehydrogenase [Brevibacillus sp. B_LB10_24]|uniref:iron-containing alcohol dehydrogenase n=1 Tax=Brevibacillus sp. B_LB10_24 TaxID=3380645 RepID=UPI0038BD37C1